MSPSNDMNIRERIKDKLFHKICAYSRCKKPFATAEPSRKFCSEDCRLANVTLRRHRQSYHRRNREDRNQKNAGRRIMRTHIRNLPEEDQHFCEFGHVIESIVDGHHCDGNTENNTDQNRLRVCDPHHAVVHHPAAFNMLQLWAFGYVLPTKMYCVKARKLVICTTLQCSGSKHCAGMEIDPDEGDLVLEDGTPTTAYNLKDVVGKIRSQNEALSSSKKGIDQGGATNDP